jgi:hypothetical protein
MHTNTHTHTHHTVAVTCFLVVLSTDDSTRQSNTNTYMHTKTYKQTHTHTHTHITVAVTCFLVVLSTGEFQEEAVMLTAVECTCALPVAFGQVNMCV